MASGDRQTSGNDLRLRDAGSELGDEVLEPFGYRGAQFFQFAGRSETADLPGIQSYLFSKDQTDHPQRIKSNAIRASIVLIYLYRNNPLANASRKKPVPQNV